MIFLIYVLLSAAVSSSVSIEKQNIFMENKNISWKNDTVPKASAFPSSTVSNRFDRDSTCIDLAFDTIRVIDIAEKYIELEFSIVNRGTASAPIFGTKRTQTDNVAVHFYFSGTTHLTRGAMLADGIYLTEGLQRTNGWLAPKGIYTQRFKLSLEKKSRFYGVIILQLDAFDVLPRECDETNNFGYVTPKWF